MRQDDEDGGGGDDDAVLDAGKTHFINGQEEDEAANRIRREVN